ncbi:MAG: SDR family NAD(P)-dependent oxidoreductase [Myxococcota bacterium]|nr:SDR family NAD(P)-dependent oxidoreductase [Myxococcota bacterium]
MNVLVTGGAGFIGSHLVERLLEEGRTVTVIDNLDDGYDPAIKRRNFASIAPHVRFVEGDIRDSEAVKRALEGVEVVAHLAARAGVRPSLEDPSTYIDINIQGTQSLLDGMHQRGVSRIVYASSSSVYGARHDGPFRETDSLAPVSPYAATKLAGELLCHAAVRNRGLQATCLRLFTVYGPRQRPEMAIHLFVRRALAAEAIHRFGTGLSRRDYTFVSDIVGGMTAAIERPRDWGVYNIGNGHPITLNELLEAISEVFDVELLVESAPDQLGDVPITWADVSKAREELGYSPQTSLRSGLVAFREWVESTRVAQG